jgi:hypothetical protein
MGLDWLSRSVIAGHSRSKNGVASARLCPAIHPSEKMDARVKPAHDALKFFDQHCGESF